MIILFALVAAMLILTYLLAPTYEDSRAPASMDDFQFPDNSIGKPVPRLYGAARLFGNCIYVGGLRNEPIEVEV